MSAGAPSAAGARLRRRADRRAGGKLFGSFGATVAGAVLVLGVPLYAMGYVVAQARACRLGSAAAPACRPVGSSAFGAGFVVVAFVVLVAAALALVAAAALAKVRVRGGRSLVVALAVVQVLPLAGIVVPGYLGAGTTYGSAPLLHHVAAVALVYVAFVVPFSLVLVRGFGLLVPRMLEEAGLVEGLTPFGAFARIVLPVVAPGVVAAALFGFVGAWNEWIFATRALGGSGRETAMLAFFRLGGGERGAPYGTVAAMSTLVALGVVVLLVVVQRRVASGFGGETAGA
jgi:N,N'-diacetylchitobiose transport system permease protein